jgi:hypothetical protein
MRAIPAIQSGKLVRARPQIVSHSMRSAGCYLTGLTYDPKTADWSPIQGLVIRMPSIGGAGNSAYSSYSRSGSDRSQGLDS